MIRYGDYFSRKELFYLGVNPNQELGVLNSDYNVENKYEKVKHRRILVLRCFLLSKNLNNNVYKDFTVV